MARQWVNMARIRKKASVSGRRTYTASKTTKRTVRTRGLWTRNPETRNAVGLITQPYFWSPCMSDAAISKTGRHKMNHYQWRQDTIMTAVFKAGYLTLILIRREETSATRPFVKTTPFYCLTLQIVYRMVRRDMTPCPRVCIQHIAQNQSTEQ
jgi:hypothetical protein